MRFTVTTFATLSLLAACSPDHKIQFEISSSELDYILDDSGDMPVELIQVDYKAAPSPLSSCSEKDFDSFRSEVATIGLGAKLCGQTLEEIVNSISR